MDRGTKRTLFAFLLAVFAALATALLSGYGVSGQIRLDTGDLRYRFLGVPFRYDAMPEPERSMLLSLAQESDRLSSEWRTCVRYPLPTSNNPDVMCRGYYVYATAWIGVDRRLARLALEDVADYVETTGAQYGLPDACLVLSPLVVERASDDTLRVIDDWRNHEDVVAYCQMKGHDVSPAGNEP
ncbi:MAG TPA: hypothetical protein VM487_05175 [Phycisphaerae bacterium]|nr:hypothetical protein [Phycisphaerae bacterium]